MAAAVIALKRAKELKEKFIEKGAVSPETALTLDELGITKKAITHLLVLRNHIIEIGDKYYMDVDKFDDRAIQKLHDFICNLFDDITE